MYSGCIPVRESGNHRIRSRYNTRGANTNVSSLAHEGSMTLRYKVPYTIQARYKQDTVEYRCIPDVATGYSQDTSKIQSNTHVSQMYPARQSSTARGLALTRRICRYYVQPVGIRTSGCILVYSVVSRCIPEPHEASHKPAYAHVEQK